MLLEERANIGISKGSSMETSEKTKGLNLKATELRLGLPGSESPERARVKLCTQSRVLFLGPKGDFQTPSMVVLGGGFSMDLSLIWPKMVGCSLLEVSMVVGRILVALRVTLWL